MSVEVLEMPRDATQIPFRDLTVGISKSGLKYPRYGGTYPGAFKASGLRQLAGLV